MASKPASLAAPAKNSTPPAVPPAPAEKDDPIKVDRRTLPNGASPGVPAGLQEFATKRLETPREMLARTLGVGESVFSSFECYFQSDRISRAEWWFLVMAEGRRKLYHQTWRARSDNFRESSLAPKVLRNAS